MLCKYTILGEHTLWEINISKYKFTDHGVLLINFDNGVTTFIPFASLGFIKFINKEGKNGKAILPGTEESGD